MGQQHHPRDETAQNKSWWAFNDSGCSKYFKMLQQQVLGTSNFGGSRFRHANGLGLWRCGAVLKLSAVFFSDKLWNHNCPKMWRHILALFVVGMPGSYFKNHWPNARGLARGMVTFDSHPSTRTWGSLQRRVEVIPSPGSNLNLSQELKHDNISYIHNIINILNSILD